MGGLGARAHLVSGLLPGRGWPRWCGGVAGLGGAWARLPVGLIWGPAVLGLAVGLGYPWSYCRGVAACWLDTESLPSSVLPRGLAGLGVAAGVWRRAGLMPSSVVLGHTVGAAYGGGLGSCGVAAGAGCDPSCA